jgi:hypothetical protein
MAKRNSSNQDFTNNADGFDLSGGVTPRKLKVSGADIEITGSGTNTITMPSHSATLQATGDDVATDHIYEANGGHGVDVDGLNIKDGAIPQEAWHEIGAVGQPAFENSWVNYNSGTHQTCAFMKDSMGFVHIKGLAKSGTATSAIFTLPTGYRPPLQVTVPSASNDTFGVLCVAANGRVFKSIGGGNAYQSVECVFKAA